MPEKSCMKSTYLWWTLTWGPATKKPLLKSSSNGFYRLFQLFLKASHTFSSTSVGVLKAPWCFWPTSYGQRSHRSHSRVHQSCSLIEQKPHLLTFPACPPWTAHIEPTQNSSCTTSRFLCNDALDLQWSTDLQLQGKNSVAKTFFQRTYHVKNSLSLK